ncbi:MAG TPA: helix-turn-helix domain-containing protein [Terriglobia bacterium]|nr:helix-turn-helix domain-containing protein [Terriglobia bacterium]
MKEQLERLVSEMIDRGLRYDEAVGEFERKFIMTALEKNKGNQTKAAKAMGIHRNTLNKRITSYNHNSRKKH